MVGWTVPSLRSGSRQTPCHSDSGVIVASLAADQVEQLVVDPRAHARALAGERPRDPLADAAGVGVDALGLDEALELEPQGLGAGVAVVDLERERTPADRIERPRQPGQVEVWQLAVAQAPDQRRLVDAGPQPATGEQLPEHHAGREHVGRAGRPPRRRTCSGDMYASLPLSPLRLASR